MLTEKLLIVSYLCSHSIINLFFLSFETKTIRQKRKFIMLARNHRPSMLKKKKKTGTAFSLTLETPSKNSKCLLTDNFNISTGIYYLLQVSTVTIEIIYWNLCS